MDYAKLKELMAQIQALLAGAEPAPVQVTYPALIAHKGVTYNLNAPLAAEYEPSQISRIMGGLPGYFVSDPSNAPPGYPNRSPAGFPLFYPLSGDGKPAGEPRVSNGENTFANDAEVLDWIRRVAEQRAAMEARAGGESFSPGRTVGGKPKPAEGGVDVPIGTE